MCVSFFLFCQTACTGTFRIFVSDVDMQQYILFNCFYADYVDFHLHDAVVHLKLYGIYSIRTHIPLCQLPLIFSLRLLHYMLSTGADMYAH